MQEHEMYMLIVIALLCSLILGVLLGIIQKHIRGIIMTRRRWGGHYRVIQKVRYDKSHTYLIQHRFYNHGDWTSLNDQGLYFSKEEAFAVADKLYKEFLEYRKGLERKVVRVYN